MNKSRHIAWTLGYGEDLSESGDFRLAGSLDDVRQWFIRVYDSNSPRKLNPNTSLDAVISALEDDCDIWAHYMEDVDEI